MRNFETVGTLFNQECIEGDRRITLHSPAGRDKTTWLMTVTTMDGKRVYEKGGFRSFDTARKHAETWKPEPVFEVCSVGLSVSDPADCKCSACN